MAYFCEFCGTKLEDGSLCGCPEATAARPQPNPAPTPVHIPTTFCEFCGTKLENGARCGCAEAAAVRAGQPLPNAEQFREIAGTTKQLAADIGREAKDSWKAVVQNPTDMAATHSFSKPLSLVLLIAEILAKVWFIDRAARAFMKGTFEVIAEKMGSGGAYMDLSLEALDAVEYFGTTEYAKIGCIMAAQTAFFAGLIYFLPKILKNNELNIAPDAALSTVAFAALPSAAATLASALLLSVLSYNSLSVYAMFAVCGAGLMASIALLDAGMKKYIQNDKTRLILLTIGYGVQLAVVLFALFSFMPACITDAIYNLMYNR